MLAYLFEMIRFQIAPGGSNPNLLVRFFYTVFGSFHDVKVIQFQFLLLSSLGSKTGTVSSLAVWALRDGKGSQFKFQFLQG